MIRWLRFLKDDAEATAGTVFFLVMVVSVSIGVLFRYGFNRPLIWTEEVSSFSFLWAIFLGAAAAVKRHEHIVVDTVVLLLPRPLQRAVGLMTGGLVAAMLAVITVLGLQYAYSQRNTTTEALETRMLWWALAVPTFSSLGFYHTLRNLWRQVRGQGKAETAPANEARGGEGGSL